MGQYYKLVLLNSHKKSYPNKKKVAAYLRSWDFNQGAKLMEFSWIGNNFVGCLEALINKESGEYAGYPVIVAGDYADEEPYTLNGEKWNIYQLASEYGHGIKPEDAPTPKHYRYVINEDKKVFIDCERMRVCGTTEWEGEKTTWQVHPLTILCSDGCNGGDARGGGDYRTKHREVGAWRRNVVVTSDNRPDESEYREVFYDFYEKW
jgi:hypothetical protein